jgi:hypothetical protein
MFTIYLRFRRIFIMEHLKNPNIELSYGDFLSEGAPSDNTLFPRAFKVTFANPNNAGVVHATLKLIGVLEGAQVTLETHTLELSQQRVVYIPLEKYYDISTFEVSVEAYVAYGSDSPTEIDVATLTESSALDKYTPVTILQTDTRALYLKAFCEFPQQDFFKPVYGLWESSPDGIRWEQVEFPNSDLETCSVSVLDLNYTPSGELQDSEEPAYMLRTFTRVSANTPADNLAGRVDVLPIVSSEDLGLPKLMYRFKMCTLREISKEDPEYISEAAYTEDYILGSKIYTPVFDSKMEYLHSDVRNVSKGSSTIYGHVLYNYGDTSFKSNIYASNPGETTHPLSKTIILDTSEEDVVTALVPWKNYIVAFTEHSVHLISKTQDGYTSSVISTYIGIPKLDANCVKATLNGIIFKSDFKIYMLYPNIYSGTEGMLNLTDISEPIEDYVYDSSPEHPPFAISTEDAYLLYLPIESATVCLKYEYVKRRWSFYKYNVVFETYKMFSVSDTRVFGSYLDEPLTEYYLNREYSDVCSNVPENIPYGDVLSPPNTPLSEAIHSWGSYTYDLDVIPIDFALDSGQKTDNLSTTKQFSETKLIIATLHPKDTFPMTILVHVDGTSYPITVDCSTDSAFWKTAQPCVGVLGASFSASTDSNLNTFRQMFLRYSGKGKSIRHIITGSSVYPFKIYELLYRYCIPNVKQ